MNLTDKNYVLYAARNYENPQCQDVDEFYTDLLIPMHLKKLLTRYHVNGVLKERLIINHIVSLFNVFNMQAAVKILFFKIDPTHHSYLKTFLTYLERCPSHIPEINNRNIIVTDIPVDETILKRLHSI